MKKILFFVLIVAMLLSGCSSGHIEIWETIEGLTEVAKLSHEAADKHLELIESNMDSIITLGEAIESLSSSIMLINDSMMILLARIEALEKRMDEQNLEGDY